MRSTHAFAIFQTRLPRVVLGAILTGAMAISGCGPKAPPRKLSRYPTLTKNPVPAYMANSLIELTDLKNDEPLVVSGYGLAVNLRGTGDNSGLPTQVRQYMIREMTKRGFGSNLKPEYRHLQPEEMMRDKTTAVVRVDGWIPPGARKYQQFDVQVSVPGKSYTSSLAQGLLYETDLKVNGAYEPNPTAAVNVYARAQGPVFVNPYHAVHGESLSPGGKVSLRYGVIMDGGSVAFDRPLKLQMRQPSFSLARRVEGRIDERFQESDTGMKTASAKDDGVVDVLVPSSYRGDWKHFGKVVRHLFLDGSPQFAARKSRELASEAVKPGAMLEDISLCWEGLGPAALPFIQPLMTHPAPDVSFAAARAAAFIGDSTANGVLMTIARHSDHPFRLDAIDALGALPSSPGVNQLLRQLLNSDEVLVRVEAYKNLARNRDSSVFSKVIENRFVLDVVPSSGPPIIHATRSGVPRIALIGEPISIRCPITFTAMDQRFMIVSGEARDRVTLFYRGDASAREPVKIESGLSLAEIVARLGGEAPLGEKRLGFSYSDVIGMLGALSESKKLVGTYNGQLVAAALVVQDPEGVQQAVYAAPELAASTAGETRADPTAIPDFKPDGAGDSGTSGARGSRPQ